MCLGQALFGPCWQRELARRLDVSERSVRYWVAGREVPAYVWPRLAALVEAQREALATFRADIDRQGAKGAKGTNFHKLV